ncbi:MAG: FlgD immunoglobulin-like domain containing protein [Candidatus Zixiibacteriota bacterium]
MRGTYLTAILVVFAAIAAAAPPPGEAEQPTPAVILEYDNNVFIDANNILMFITNHGQFGRDLANVFGYSYGTWFPYTGDTAAIADNLNGAGEHSPQYAAGLWIAGVDGADIKVAICSQNTDEYTPGPMADSSFVPDDPAYKVYKLYSDSLEGNPNSDYTNWPEGQGAPVDALGNPVMLGDQMLWSVFNDANPARHTVTGGKTPPLAVEIRHTTYAYDRTDYRGYVVFLRYKLYNRGPNTLTDCYVGIWADPDIGNSSDDLTGCDTTSDIFYAYNGYSTDAQYGSNPPAMAYKILKGPIVPSVNDTAYFDGYLIPDCKNLRLESFRRYGTADGPTDSSETYNIMRGLLKDGSPLVIGGTWDVPGDPIEEEGSYDLGPGDRAMLGCCGPFNFNPGDSQYVLVALACGQGTDYKNSITVAINILNQITDFPLDAPPVQSRTLPSSFIVKQNYPNPFNPVTIIEYSLPARAQVNISIYNILGQRVTTIVDSEQPAGTHTAVWDGRDQSGAPVSSGFYFYRVSAGELIDTKKMLLLK